MDVPQSGRVGISMRLVYCSPPPSTIEQLLCWYFARLILVHYNKASKARLNTTTGMCIRTTYYNTITHGSCSLHQYNAIPIGNYIFALSVVVFLTFRRFTYFILRLDMEAYIIRLNKRPFFIRKQLKFHSCKFSHNKYEGENLQENLQP